VTWNESKAEELAVRLGNVGSGNEAIEAFVTDSSTPARWLPRVSIRGLLFLILLAALLFGWRASQQRAERERRQQEHRLRYAEEELSRARDELQDQQRGPRPDRARSFWEADLEGSNLAGMTIASAGNAFQRASFRRCRLEGATLEGGASSFQFARFDAAKLARACLKGGSSSFQASSFLGADLTGATLIGGSGSFQRASFEEAILIGAKLSGNFQLVNISGARFEAADLSAIAHDNLASCYFKEPPTYDARTRFPPGFDPVDRSWRRAE
jgi:type II secretory pathway pseudopilin PulG